MKRKSLKNIKLNRTVGLEFEGYVKNVGRVPYASSRGDGSLMYETSSGRRGVEYVTEPLSELDKIDEVMQGLKNCSWSVGRTRPSTHIHVDASDYNLYDYQKAITFLLGIQETMFLLVKPYRMYNRFCQMLGHSKQGFKEFLSHLKSIGVDPSSYESIWQVRNDTYYGNLVNNRNSISRFMSDIKVGNRYVWANIFNSSHKTIEFRIFHALSSANEAKKFALLSYHIVETIKNSTLNHLEYLVQTIESKGTSDEKIQALFESVGFEHSIKVSNKNHKEIIDRKYQRAVREHLATIG
jgi:hypothetical protein